METDSWRPSRRPTICRCSTRICCRSRASLHAKLQDRAAATTRPILANAHAIPLTVDEFVTAQRHFPIVFSVGRQSGAAGADGAQRGRQRLRRRRGQAAQPGLCPGLCPPLSVLLARLDPNAEELSLCFDPTSDLIGEFDEGEALFDGDKPSETLNGDPRFCEDFEIAGAAHQGLRQGAAGDATC